MHKFAVPLLAWLALATVGVPQAFGHGLPINVSVDNAGRLRTMYDPATGTDVRAFEGDLELIAGVLITTTLPGFGVLTTSQGLQSGDQLELNVLQKLLYFDGSAVVPAVDTLILENHDGDFFNVTGASGFQGPLHWGTYSGLAGWHRDGAYSISPGAVPPNAVPPGAYGLVLQLSSPRHDSSPAFVIGFNYGLDHATFHEGLEAFEAAAIPEPSSAVLAMLGMVGSSLMVVRRRRRGS